MKNRIVAAALPLLLLASPHGAGAASGSVAIEATVPVYCKVNHVGAGSGAVSGEMVSLGGISEFCNAPRGYRLMVRYRAGSLVGATVYVGQDRVVLDGSGTALLSESHRPRIRERPLSAIVGENGFDTDRLELQIVPTV